MLVPLPDAAEQNAITDRIVDLNDHERLSERELDRLQRLKSALMSDLLTGRTPGRGHLHRGRRVTRHDNSFQRLHHLRRRKRRPQSSGGQPRVPAIRPCLLHRAEG